MTWTILFLEFLYMKIAIILSSFEGGNTGRGGHYQSALTLAEALNRETTAIIINIGNFKAPALAGCKLSSHFVYANSPTDYRCLRQIRRILVENSVDVLHGFDRKSVSILKMLSLCYAYSTVFTLAGGPSSVRNFPRVNEFIVFTKKHYDDARGLKKFASTRLHWIPNRVKHLEVNGARLMGTVFDQEKSKVRLLTINRLCRTKQYQISQALTLLDELVSAGCDVHLYVIGHDEGTMDAEVYSRLKHRNCTVLTDPTYTIQASDWIPFCDIVVGMGRTVMEAAAYGKPILVSPSQSRVPTPLHDGNFEAFFEENFTSRSTFYCADEESIASVVSLCTSEDLRKEQAQFCSEIFRRWFSVEEVIPQYLELYANAAPSRRITNDMLIDFWRFMSGFFYPSSRKGFSL